MTKIAISPNPNGTGTFTIAAPNSNTDRTLTLPDAVGSVVLNEGSGTFKIDSTGNVGVGTSSPASPLHIYNSSPFIRLTDADLDTRHAIIGGQNGNLTIDIDPNQTAAASLFSVNIDNTERMRINSSGNASIGTSTATSARLVVGKNGATAYNTGQLELFSDTGDVILGFHCAGASATVIDHVRTGNGVRIVALDRSVFAPIAASAFNVNSDYRIKENITPLTGAVDRLMQLPVHRFSFVEGSMSYQDGVTVDGFLAHEAQVVVPEAVTGDKDAVDADGNPILQAIDQSKLIPLLTAALQEALADIATLKAEVAALKGASA